MNSTELEIYQAIRQAQRGPTIIRYLCPICKDYLNEWDAKASKTICWKCRKTCWPKPKVEEKNLEPKRPRLVPMKDGSWAVMVD